MNLPELLTASPAPSKSAPSGAPGVDPAAPADTSFDLVFGESQRTVAAPATAEAEAAALAERAALQAKAAAQAGEAQELASDAAAKPTDTVAISQAGSDIQSAETARLGVAGSTGPRQSGDTVLAAPSTRSTPGPTSKPTSANGDVSGQQVTITRPPDSASSPENGVVAKGAATVRPDTPGGPGVPASAPDAAVQPSAQTIARADRLADTQAVQTSSGTNGAAGALGKAEDLKAGTTPPPATQHAKSEGPLPSRVDQAIAMKSATAQTIAPEQSAAEKASKSAQVSTNATPVAESARVLSAPPISTQATLPQTPKTQDRTKPLASSSPDQPPAQPARIANPSRLAEAVVTEKAALSDAPGPESQGADLRRPIAEPLSGLNQFSIAKPSRGASGDILLSTTALSSAAPSVAATDPMANLTAPGQKGAAQIVERTIAPQITAAMTTRPNGGVIDLMLDPPDLGRIEILMELGEQGLRATLTAERSATGDLMRRNADTLLQQLEDAGFKDIDLSFADSHDGAAAAWHEADVTPSGARSETAAPLTPSLDRNPVRVSASGLDIRL